MNTDFTSIQGFIKSSGASYRVFDLGRRVEKLSSDWFQRFEAGQEAYHYPFQRQAWLGILFWNQAEIQEHFIWFIKLPLDETGKLSLSARDDFLKILIEKIGDNLIKAQKGEKLHYVLADNPYTFSPKQDRLAMFHAKAAKTVGNQASQFYNEVQEYLRRGALDEWQTLGLQGIADFVARLDDDNNARVLKNALEQMPIEPYGAFASMLEHEKIGVELAETIQQRLRRALQQNEPGLAEVVTGLRAISCSSAEGLRKPLLLDVLSRPIGRNVEILAAIASRCWHDLRDQDLVVTYLEALAENELGQDAFNQLLADLMFIPGLRQGFLQAFRHPQRSASLSQKMGGMFGA